MLEFIKQTEKPEWSVYKISDGGYIIADLMISSRRLNLNDKHKWNWVIIAGPEGFSNREALEDGISDTREKAIKDGKAAAKKLWK